MKLLSFNLSEDKFGKLDLFYDKTQQHFHDCKNTRIIDVLWIYKFEKLSSQSSILNM